MATSPVDTPTWRVRVSSRLRRRAHGSRSPAPGRSSALRRRRHRPNAPATNNERSAATRTGRCRASVASRSATVEAAASASVRSSSRRSRCVGVDRHRDHRGPRLHRRYPTPRRHLVRGAGAAPTAGAGACSRTPRGALAPGARTSPPSSVSRRRRSPNSSRRVRAGRDAARRRPRLVRRPRQPGSVGSAVERGANPTRAEWEQDGRHDAHPDQEVDQRSRATDNGTSVTTTHEAPGTSIDVDEL